MALKNKTNNNQISFDDLSCEGAVNEVYTTITGKEQAYLPEYEVYKTYECDVGDELTGYPEVSIITKKEKSYDTLKLRIIDEIGGEILEAYANFPRPNENDLIKRLDKDFDFYRNAFDFIYGVRKCQGERYVLDKNGDEYDAWTNLDFIGHAKLVDQMSKVTVKITEGNEDSTYNSWEIINME